MKLECHYLESCHGCPLGSLDTAEQKKHKQKKFQDCLIANLSPRALIHTKFDFIFPVFDSYRVRSDFVFQDGQLGWFTANKRFLPIDTCALHTNELKSFVRQLAAHQPPIKKGSFRFRIGRDGKKGLWMDLSNLDIKDILSNSSYLSYFFENDIALEMGQKGKRVQFVSGSYKLTEPTPESWFESWFDGKSVPLYSLISSFTQTSPWINIQMIQIVARRIGGKRWSDVIEFGCGVGNFTLFLSEIGSQLTVIENDFRNLIPLRKNLESYGIEDKVRIFSNIKDYIASSSTGTSQSFPGRLVFVNPARSGVGALFDQPIPADHVIYISCHLESFAKDIAKLDAQGFVLSDATLFDQFPHSEHFEIISFFERS